MSNEKKRNVLAVVIDALRYDVIADDTLRAHLTPNLDRLARRGFMRRVTTNAPLTQFVLPSLFTQSYPFDHGGYNAGIRERPSSFVESIREQGRFTYLAASCYNYGIGQGYPRGFDSVLFLCDMTRNVKRVIVRTLAYNLELCRGGELSKQDVIEEVRKEFTALYKESLDLADSIPRRNWFLRWLRWFNMNVVRGLEKELSLLEREPETVLRKLEAVDSPYYWTCLGRPRAGLKTFLHSKLDALRGILRWPLKGHVRFNRLADVRVPCHLMLRETALVLGARKSPWFAWVHLMDVHDFAYWQGLSDALRKLSLLPRLLRFRRRYSAARPLLHDLTLMQSDRELGKMLDRLERQGAMADTAVVVTADHGVHLEGMGPRPKQPLVSSLYSEHLHVPLIVSGVGEGPDATGMIDSMSISSTILDLLGVEPTPGFLGVSALSTGRDFVISELVGPGNCDLDCRDLYFTVTTPTHRMMTVLREGDLKLLRLYDLRQDPDEQQDLSANGDCCAVTDGLVDVLLRERDEVFRRRGCDDASRLSLTHAEF